MRKMFLNLWIVALAIPIFSMEKPEGDFNGGEIAIDVANDQKVDGKDELYLVVGSNRAKNACAGHIVDAIYRTKNVDNSYRNIINKIVTSMDHLPCAITNVPHIIGDASHYIFDQPIRWVYLENPATTKQSESIIYSTTEQILKDSLINHVGNIINNISKYMPKGAVMEIQWFPYTGISSAPFKILENAIGQNPFHTFFNMNVVFQSIFILAGETNNINLLPDELKTPTIKMIEDIQNLLQFYEKQKIGKSYAELLSTIFCEARIIHHMFINNYSNIFLDYKVLDQDASKMKVAIEKLLHGQVKAKFNGNNILVDGYVYEMPDFWRRSFIGVVVADLAAQYNRPRLIQYLKSLAFDDISVERRDNPYTNRKNVWMIKMTKR